MKWGSKTLIVVAVGALLFAGAAVLTETYLQRKWAQWVDRIKPDTDTVRNAAAELAEIIETTKQVGGGAARGAWRAWLRRYDPRGLIR